MEIHLAFSAEVQGDGAAFALVVEGNDLCVHILIVLTRQRADLLAVGIGDDDVAGITVAAKGQRDDGLRTNEQVDLVLGVALEGPAVLCIVPVEAASGIEGLVVSSVEELVCEVEVILLIGAGLLNLCGDSVEGDVAGDDIFSSPLFAAGGLLEPAAHLCALKSCSGIVVHIKLADGLVLLTGELTKYRLLVGVDVGQREVGLLCEVDDIVE